MSTRLEGPRVVDQVESPVVRREQQIAFVPVGVHDQGVEHPRERLLIPDHGRHVRFQPPKELRSLFTVALTKPVPITVR